MFPTPNHQLFCQRVYKFSQLVPPPKNKSQLLSQDLSHVRRAVIQHGSQIYVVFLCFDNPSIPRRHNSKFSLSGPLDTRTLARIVGNPGSEGWHHHG